MPSDAPYLILRKDDQIDTKKLEYQLTRENLWSVKHKSGSQEPAQSIYLQTPALQLSAVEVDKFNYYLICRVDDQDQEFWDLITDLDMSSIENISRNPKRWGISHETPLTFIERRFIPTLKMSTLNYEYCLHLLIPKTDEVGIWDESNNPISIEQLQRDSRVTLLLNLDGVELSNRYFQLKFILEQVKVKSDGSSRSRKRAVSRDSRKGSRFQSRTRSRSRRRSRSRASSLVSSRASSRINSSDYSDEGSRRSRVSTQEGGTDLDFDPSDYEDDDEEFEDLEEQDDEVTREHYTDTRNFAANAQHSNHHKSSHQDDVSTLSQIAAKFANKVYDEDADTFYDKSRRH